ncbi:GNAT family N-acetyltransferase [uncultured Chryseobacterium sp.]|uniref:GNAT family N-acetyltransferase n=1 Tax=uncultured Chryseobacterium sp. TaxID=259322 RepID=UPI0026009117|nr:GNAT family N-acetyltransferase [uncultured Chryseobacterium sp.]
MNFYKALDKQIYSRDGYSIVPIRIEDRYDIMRWRNEQIYHLRQNKPLTKEEQDNYFDNVVTGLFTDAFPKQLLFSYLKDEKCIGYGGLVHINWIDKNAEISFIMDTSLEENFFLFHWKKYLELIEEAAFFDLKLHKIYVYAFDLRPHLYEALQECNFFLDAVLKEHCLYNGRYIDVIIYSKTNSL